MRWPRPAFIAAFVAVGANAVAQPLIERAITEGRRPSDVPLAQRPVAFFKVLTDLADHWRPP